jgi:hypothetical protein
MGNSGSKKVVRTMKAFDFYATVGVITPGVFFAVGMNLLYAQSYGKEILALQNISLGSLGVGLILAYTAGQLIQVIGSFIDLLSRLPKGWPTSWLRRNKGNILAKEQRKIIESRVRIMIDHPDFSLDQVNPKDWHAITRQIHAAVDAAGRNKRVDMFNGNYGLCRGLISAGILLLAISFLFHFNPDWKILIILIVIIFVALIRLREFAIHYERELFVQYLELSAKTKDN